VTEGHLNVLPPGYQLHWYRLERVLGQGGFGITYLARDSNLDQLVAIKEYLPVEFAARASDHTVQPRSQKYGEDYEWGRDRFVSEAQTLAQFDHPNIVRAYSVFEHNNTAYMVMRYEQGENLQTLLEREETLSEAALIAIVLPILDGLQAIHAAGFIHRDIKPDNILIREDGSPVLLDFGSARRIIGKTHTLTILMSPGYAPFEQYQAGDEQGPWTDIYSLAATLYHGVTGKPPVDAIARSKGVLGSTKDVLVPASKIGRGRYSPHFLQAIDHGLAFDRKDRPQALPIWKEELCGRRVLAAFARRLRRSVSRRVATAAAVLIVLSLLGWLLSERQGEPLSPAGQQTMNDERLAALEQQLAGMENRLAQEREVSQASLQRAQGAEAALRQQLATMEKQLAEKQEGSQTISSQDQERIAALRERLAALGKDLEDQKRSEAGLLAREKKLREERARFEEERRQWREEKLRTAGCDSTRQTDTTSYDHGEGSPDGPKRYRVYVIQDRNLSCQRLLRL
jgi:serine/threonine protein kinase